VSPTPGALSGNLIFREPRESELALCRMLLPEACATPVDRLFRLAFESREMDGTPTTSLAGALSYRDDGTDFSGLRLHVVKNRRRRGIGSRLVDYVIDQARSLGRSRILADADIHNEPDAEPFLTSRGFAIIGRVTSVETEYVQMKTQDRLDSAEGLPESSRVVALENAPIDQILEMYAQHIANLPMMAGMLRTFRAEEYPESVVLMIGDRVIAFMLAQVKDGVLYVPAWVSRPDYRGKRIGLRMIPLMRKRIAEREPIIGKLKRLRFDFADVATYTAKLTAEVNYNIVRISARFERVVGPAGP
jgi:GNAT superfamily N-acetyltransferase